MPSSIVACGPEPDRPRDPAGEATRIGSAGRNGGRASMNDHAALAAGGAVVPVRRRGDYQQSVLVVGTAQLGGAYAIANRTGVPDDDAAARILAAAGELGVTHLDTARAY